MTKMIPEKLKEPLKLTGHGLQLGLIPLAMWLGPEYLDMRDRILEMETKVEYVQTQWGILQTLETELQALKVTTGVNDKLIAVLGCSNKLNDKRPRRSSYNHPSTPSSGQSGRTQAPQQKQPLNDYIQQKQRKYKSGK